MLHKALSWIVSVLSFPTETTLLYFFSSLAQCSAAFAAFAGVFAVFRLQWNESHIQEVYRRGIYCLSRLDRVAFQEFLPKNRVKERLQLWTESSDRNLALEAKEHLETINQREKETDNIGNGLSMPLKMWFLIFLFSIAILPFLRLYEGLPGLLAIGLYLLAVIVAGIITASFVQQCLSVPKLKDEV